MAQKEPFFYFIMRLPTGGADDLRALQSFLLLIVPVELREIFDLATGVFLINMTFSYPEGDRLYEKLCQVFHQYHNVNPDAEALVFPVDRRFFEFVDSRFLSLRNPNK